MEKEIAKLLKMPYDECCIYLQNKYGIPKKDYFNDKNFSYKNKNLRNKEGLLIYHWDSNKANKLTNLTAASKLSFEYQKANRLVYCDLLERLVLRIKTIEYTTKNFENFIGYNSRNECDEHAGYYVWFSFRLPEHDIQMLNDTYSMFRLKYLNPPKNHMSNHNNIFRLIKERYDEYLLCIEYIISHPNLYISNLTNSYYLSNWQGHYWNFDVYNDIQNIYKKHKNVFLEKEKIIEEKTKKLWEDCVFENMNIFLNQKSVNGEKIIKIKNFFINSWFSNYLEETQKIRWNLEPEVKEELINKIWIKYKNKTKKEIESKLDIEIPDIDDLFIKKLDNYQFERESENIERIEKSDEYQILFNEFNDNESLSLEWHSKNYKQIKEFVDEQKDIVLKNKYLKIFEEINGEPNEFQEKFLWELFKNAHLFNQIWSEIFLSLEQLDCHLFPNNKNMELFVDELKSGINKIKIYASLIKYYSQKCEEFLQEKQELKNSTKKIKQKLKQNYEKFKNINYINDVLIDIKLMEEKGLNVWINKDQVDKLLTKNKLFEKYYENLVYKAFEIENVEIENLTDNVEFLFSLNDFAFLLTLKNESENKVWIGYKELIEMLNYCSKELVFFDNKFYNKIKKQNLENAEIIKKILLNKNNGLLVYVDNENHKINKKEFGFSEEEIDAFNLPYISTKETKQPCRFYYQAIVYNQNPKILEDYHEESKEK